MKHQQEEPDKKSNHDFSFYLNKCKKCRGIYINILNDNKIGMYDFLLFFQETNARYFVYNANI